jgi:hypothetical protein
VVPWGFVTRYGDDGTLPIIEKLENLGLKIKVRQTRKSSWGWPSAIE